MVARLPKDIAMKSLFKTIIVAILVSAFLIPVSISSTKTTEDIFTSKLTQEYVKPIINTELTNINISTLPLEKTKTAVNTVAYTPKNNTNSTNTVSTSSDDLNSILANYIAKYPILAGCSVSYGDASGYQAVAYYKSGRIVISPTHIASLNKIIGHEIWHIIDWRDNNVIDWGENIPPR